MLTPAALTRRREHLFYTNLSVLLALTVLVGFSRTFYAKGLTGTPPLSRITHLHGAVFTLWVLFFVLQTTLVAARRIGLHRTLGWVGAGLAAVVVTVGAVMMLHSVRAGYATGRPNMPLLLIDSICDLALFCLFFAGALLLRRNKELHKRLMILGMIILIIPAIARLPLSNRAVGIVILGFTLLTVAYDAILLRRVYLLNLIGVFLINISSPLRFLLAETRQWQSFAHWIATFRDPFSDVRSFFG